MDKEKISPEQFKEEAAPPLKEAGVLADLQKEFGDFFSPEDLQKISKNPDALYFNLPNIFNKLSKEGKFEEINHLQELALKRLAERSPEQKRIIQFPAKKPPLFERLRKLLKSLKAAFLGFTFLATSAVALDAGRRITQERPSETKIEEIAPKPPKHICTENMCQIVTEKPSAAKMEDDLKSFLGDSEKFSKLTPKEQAEEKPFLEETYRFIINKNLEAAKNPNIQKLTLQIEGALSPQLLDFLSLIR